MTTDVLATYQAPVEGLACRLSDRLDGAARARFDAFVATSPCGTYLQRSSWPEFARPEYDGANLPDMTSQWRMVQEQGGVFLLAELDGELIGGHVVLHQGDVAFWLTLGTSSDHPDVPRSYTLLWEAMRIAKAQGCRAYDVAGLSVGEAKDLGERNRLQFKTAFDPIPVNLVPVHVFVVRPLSHALLFRARQAYRGSRLKRYVAPLLRRRRS